MTPVSTAPIRCRATAVAVLLCVLASAAGAATPDKASVKAKPIATVKAKPAATAPQAPPAAPLTDAELEVASAVHVGALGCELGQSVNVDPDPAAPGHFRLQLHKAVYRMRPVESRTGAVRLEDEAQGAVWIQLANKSMLMSQKLGRRLADECAGTVQRGVAQAMKLNPLPSLLDPQ